MNSLVYSVRRLRANPGFTLIAFLSLALGIGANTAIFSVLDQIVLKPLPVPRPDRLAFLNRKGVFPVYSYPAYRDFAQRATLIAGLAAYRFIPVSLAAGDAGQNARVWGYMVSANYFATLGVKAARGRFFVPADDAKPGASPIVVLSHGAWQSRFAGDPQIIGRTLRINGRVFTVIGVAPPDFFGTEVFFRPEFWAPMSMQAQVEPGFDWLERRGTSDILLFARLLDGATRAQVEAEFNGIANQLNKEHPQTDTGMNLHLADLGLIGSTMRGPVVGFAAVLMGVAGLLLLMTCTNLAGILLAKATDRRKEMAIRQALGAGKGQLIRQLLAESILLSLLGGILAALVVLWARDLFAVWRPPVDFSMPAILTVDWRVFAFNFAVSVVAGVLFSLAPALSATKVDLAPAMKNEPLAGRLRRIAARDLLVGLQIAFSVMLVFATLLAVRNLEHATKMPVGFDPNQLYMAAVDLSLEGYSPERASSFQTALLARARALPGVESAALGGTIPLSIDRSTTSVIPEDYPVPAGVQAPQAYVYNAGPGYFSTMRTQLKEGREFDDRDLRPRTATAVVNETFVRKILKGGPAVGRRFRSGREWIEIVGVVRDGKYLSLGEAPAPVVFFPFLRSFTSLIVRSQRGGQDMLDAMRRLFAELDPAMTVFGLMSFHQHLDRPLFPARIAATMLSLLGALAMFLAAVGVYGVIAYAVARRTREIGIRMALGARGVDVLRLFVRQNGLIVVVSVGVGLTASAVLGRFLSPILAGIDPLDGPALAISAAGILLLAGAAAYGPARRAMTADPLHSLRAE